MSNFLKLFALILITLTSLNAQSACSTNWEKKEGTTCVFAGNDANSYTRECSNTCWIRRNRRNWGPHCNVDAICFPKNPAELKSVCSKWYQESGVTCLNSGSGDWEQKWVRVCTRGFQLEACSKKYPRF